MALILLVEDEEPVRKVMIEALNREHWIVEVSTAEEALEVLKRAVPNLIILHMLLKDGMSGLEFCTILRQIPHMKAVPLMIISGYAERDLISDTFVLGANSFLSKPFDINEMQNMVTGLTEEEAKTSRRLATRLVDATKFEIEEALKLAVKDDPETLKLVKLATRRVEKDVKNGGAE